MNRTWPRYVLQVAFYAAFAAFVGLLAPGPSYRHLEPHLATIKLSIRHAGQPVGDCRERTAEEMAQLPPNMRAPQICPQERSPLELVLLLNGELTVSETLPPRGLRRDGRASMYRRLSVPAGTVRVDVKLKNDVRVDGFQYESSAVVSLRPAEVLVIDFDEAAKAFVFSRPVERPGVRAG